MKINVTETTVVELNYSLVENNKILDDLEMTFNLMTT